MRRLLTHHELATLLLILSSPAQVALSDPDLMTLQQESLVEVVARAPDVALPHLTSDGMAILKRLGAT